MRYRVALATTLFAIVLMSDVRVAMAVDTAGRKVTGQQLWQEQAGQHMRFERVRAPATLAADPADVRPRIHPPGDFFPAIRVDFDTLLSAHMGQSRWSTPESPAPFSFFRNMPAGENGRGAEALLLVQDEPGVSAYEKKAPRAFGRDWGGLGRDTAFFMGYQVVAAGITYLLPESVSKWTAEQKKPSVRRWWENVQHPVWDRDNVYVNYIGHPYFGAAYYMRARERGFGALGSFWYAVLLSCLYEFGIEAFFEWPSYQDLIVTPVGGALLGAFIFEPIRERIQVKPERQWYDHLAFTLTDPLGTANSILERVLGIQAELRVQVRPPALALPEPFNDRTARALNRQEAHPRRSHGVNIEFIFVGKKRSARGNR